MSNLWTGSGGYVPTLNPQGPPPIVDVMEPNLGAASGTTVQHGKPRRPRRKKPKKGPKWLAADRRRERRRRQRLRAGANPSGGGAVGGGASGGGSVSSRGPGRVAAPAASGFPWDTEAAVRAEIRSRVAPWRSQRGQAQRQLAATLAASRANSVELARQLASLASSQGLIAQQDAATQKAQLAGLGELASGIRADAETSLASNPNLSSNMWAAYQHAIGPESASTYGNMVGQGAEAQMLRQAQQDFFNRSQAVAGVTQQQFEQSQRQALADRQRAIAEQIAAERGKRASLRRQYGMEDLAFQRQILGEDREYGLQRAQLREQRRQFDAQLAADERAAELDAATNGGLSSGQLSAAQKILWGEVKNVRRRTKKKIGPPGKKKYQWVSETKAGVGKATGWREAIRRLLTLGVSQEQAEQMAITAGFLPPADVQRAAQGIVGGIGSGAQGVVGNLFGGR